MPRFDWMAGNVRKTLEAEMMRWGGRTASSGDTGLHSPDSDPAYLRAAWEWRINEIRFTPPGGEAGDDCPAPAAPPHQPQNRCLRGRTAQPHPADGHHLE